MKSAKLHTPAPPLSRLAGPCRRPNHVQLRDASVLDKRNIGSRDTKCFPEDSTALHRSLPSLWWPAAGPSASKLVSGGSILRSAPTEPLTAGWFLAFSHGGIR